MTVAPLGPSRRRPLVTFEQRQAAELTAQLLAGELAIVLDSLLERQVAPPPQPAALEWGDNFGYQQLIDGAAPGPGLDFSYPVPGDVTVYPLSVMCQVVTSGVAGDRSVAVEYRDGDDVRYVICGAPVTVPANTTQSFCWHPLVGNPSWPVEDAALAPLVQQHLYSPARLAITVWDGDAGDVIEQVRVSAQFFPQPG